MKTVHIIGAGPAGLIAAEKLAPHCTVHVYERKTSIGRKFLMAGRGGLNLTHSEDITLFLSRYREAQGFLEHLIDAFTPGDLDAWCENLGQETFIGSSGRVFPKAMKASPLLRAWLARLSQDGVMFHTEHTWKGWDNKGDLLFQTKDGAIKNVQSDATLLALGGASWPQLGSDGTWISFLEEKKVAVEPFRPSNCGFTVQWSDYFKERFSGTPLKSISITHNAETARGEAMISEKGIEGGSIYALSAPIRDDIQEHGSTRIMLDLRPAMRMDLLLQKLEKDRARLSFSTWLQKRLHLSPVAISLLREIDPDIQKKPVSELAHLIKSCPLTLHAPFPLEKAISSAGGLMLTELDSGLMIKKLPGVFAAGEMLDWEAPTGGYLLQGSFATGVAAAMGIMTYLNGE